MDKVPSLSIVCMAISCFISFALPIGLFLYFRIRKKADILPFFVGCGVMLLFAFVLERAVHAAVLGSPAGETILNNTLLYALYGGAMAGLFEETGRFAAFKTVLKSRQGNDANALMYGAGHGGFESAVILGITMINNIMISMMINSGRAGQLTASLSGDALAQTESAIRGLVTTTPYLFLLGSVERILAVILQISLSVLVWFAAKRAKDFIFYPLAVGMHFFVDGVTVILSGKGVPAAAIEVAVGIMVTVCTGIAVRVWKTRAEQVPPAGLSQDP